MYELESECYLFFVWFIMELLNCICDWWFFKIYFNYFYCRWILKFEFYLIRGKIFMSEVIVDLRDKIDLELYLIN